MEYWTRRKGSWSVKVQAIAGRLDIPKGCILGIIRAACRVESKIHICPDCGTRRSYESRYDFDEADHKSAWICSACTVSKAARNSE